MQVFRTCKKESFLQDYCDGKAFQEHPLFNTEKKALQLIIYYDEIETCNPLGSYTSVHKLGIIIILLLNFYVYHTLINNVQGQFYYILGNLEPRLRSTLKGIQLIACITSPNMKKYGLKKVLMPFIDDVNKLSKVIILLVLIIAT